MESNEVEIIELIKSFEKNVVKYIIVGGFATNFHGYKRTTGDIDIWLKDNHQNRSNLIQALDELGFGKFEPLLTLPLIPGYCEILLDNGMYADLMSQITGFTQEDFDKSYDQASIELIDGVPFKFLNYQDHLYSKKSSNRLKDKLDVEGLTQLSYEEE